MIASDGSVRGGGVWVAIKWYHESQKEFNCPLIELLQLNKLMNLSQKLSRSLLGGCTCIKILFDI